MPEPRTTLPLFRFRLLEASGVIHGITGRTDMLPAWGDISYVTGPAPNTVFANRSAWSDALGLDPDAWVCARQTHSTNVAVVDQRHAGSGARAITTAIANTDALVTATPGLPVAVACADCVPLLFHDPARQVVASVHAGWRGTVANVAGAAVEAMRSVFGTDPSDLVVGIGPSIGACCYEVGPEVIESWRAMGLDGDDQALKTRAGRVYLDLWRANQIALIAAGVPLRNIELAAICTRCHADAFFSHRAKQDPPGRFAAIIALKGEMPQW